MKRNNAWCYVYFMVARETESAVHWVKIGYSKAPVDRAIAILTGLPLPVARFGYLFCLSETTAKRLERELHKVFAERKGPSGSEWFRFDWSRTEERALLLDGIMACSNGLGVSTDIQTVQPEDLLALSKHKNAQRYAKLRQAEKEARSKMGSRRSKRNPAPLDMIN